MLFLGQSERGRITLQNADQIGVEQIPVKSGAALRVVMPLLEEPVADRRNWTIPRLRAEVAAREGVRISRSQLSKALHKKSSVGGDRGTR